MTPDASRTRAKQLRVDIQALRGVAVTLVVLYHAHIGFGAGFLGVDIFFVISGYLITGIIAKGITEGRFSFTQFYFRRAKRLLPAAYAVFFVTILLAPLFLITHELWLFRNQMAGALTFSANVIMLNQSGYFDGAAELKPLLHVWSLSLEEQFYFVLPLTLVLTRPRHWMKLSIAVVVTSLVLYAYGTSRMPDATFYLLPARAWELGIGSIGALVAASGPLRRVANMLAPWIVLPLIVIPAYPVNALNPAFSTVIVCVATAIILVGHHAGLNASRVAKGLARIGDFSYSLYLVHWPIDAFANNAWAGDANLLPLPVRLGLASLAFVLGYALYRLVEKPTHESYFNLSRRVFAMALSSSAALVILVLLLTRPSPRSEAYAAMRTLSRGFNETCDLDGHIDASTTCRTSATPTVMVWGDSYGMHLIPAMLASGDSLGIVQLTSGSCGPLVDIAPISFTIRKWNRAWAERCVRFNNDVLQYLASTPSITVVILSSPFVQYVQPQQYSLLVRAAGTTEVMDENVDRAAQALERSIARIRALGRRAIIIAPPPSSGFNIGTCLERMADRKFTFGAPPGCQIDVTAYHTNRASVLTLLERVEREADVPVYRFDALLCGATTCRTQSDGVFLYRDEGHLTPPGSALLGKRERLAQQWIAQAR